MANEQEQPVTRGTLGITGLTMNAMALIAPGAFLWLTFQMQSLYGAPMAGISMWFRHFVRPAALFRNSDQLRGTVKALSGSGFVLPVC